MLNIKNRKHKREWLLFLAIPKSYETIPFLEKGLENLERVKQSSAIVIVMQLIVYFMGFRMEKISKMFIKHKTDLECKRKAILTL